VTQPRRVLIGWDYAARGIWRVLTRQEKEGLVPPGRWSGTPPQGSHERPRPWSDRLSGGLLDDLRAWNDACAAADAGARATAGAAPDGLQERGRDLAIRVQDELGTDGWEVLYQMGGRMFRVHPEGSWPIESWQQELLGYDPRPPERSG
jgi:hypothetical protein